MEDIEKLATSTDPILACCLCGRLLRDAVQLSCLHSCCQCCFSAAASASPSGEVACRSCGDATHAGAQQPNGFVDQQVQRYKAIADSRACGACKENGEPGNAALMWCPACKHSLCGDCLPLHKQYKKSHVTQSLDELESLEAVCPQPSATTCPVHKKLLEIACLNCEQAKCSSCWAECKKNKHDMHSVGDDLFEKYVDKIIAFISSKESALLQKAGILEKPKSLLEDLKTARAHHLEQIKQRKRRVVDAVDVAYQQIECFTKDAYDDLEKEACDASAVAERITSNLSDAMYYIRRIFEANSKCEILNQQKIIRERLKMLSKKIDTARSTLDAIRAVNIDSSLPVDLETIVKSWIGVPHMNLEQSIHMHLQSKQHYNRKFLLTPKSHSPDVWLQREEVLRHRSDYAYRPVFMRSKVTLTKSEELSRSFRNMLNKLTAQNFETLVSRVLTLPIDAEVDLRLVVCLTYEKAVSEPGYSDLYATLCKAMSPIKVTTDKPGEVVDFRKLLLTRCQREFEKDLKDEEDSKAKLEALQKAKNEEIKKCLQEEYDLFVFKARRRSLGSIRFVGELFKQKMLSEDIMHDCIVKLLKNNEEDSLECLCDLLKTTGKDIDHEKAKHKGSLAAKGSDSSFGSRSKRTVEPPHPKIEKERKSDISRIDLSNIAGVVVIDDQNSKAATDDDGWQDEEGFQELTSKKKLKQKIQEAAAAAHAREVAQLQRRKKSEAATAARAVAAAAAAATAAFAGTLLEPSHQRPDVTPKGLVSGPSSVRSGTGVSAVSNDSRNTRANQLPPRVARQREEKMKRKHATQIAATSAGGSSIDQLKIDHWPSDGPPGPAIVGQLPRTAGAAPPSESATGSVASPATSLPKPDASASVEPFVSTAVGSSLAASSSALPLVSSTEPNAGTAASNAGRAVDTVLAAGVAIGAAPAAKTAQPPRAPVVSRSSSDRKLTNGTLANVAVQLPACAGMESSDPRIKFAFDIDSARVADSEERAAAAAAAEAAAAVSSPADLVVTGVPAASLTGSAEPAGSVPDLSQKIDSVKTLWDAPSCGTSGSSSGSATAAVPVSVSGSGPAVVLSSILKPPFSGTSSTSSVAVAPVREQSGTAGQTTVTQPSASATGLASAIASTGAEQTNICMVKPQLVGSSTSLPVAPSPSSNEKDGSSASGSNVGLTTSTPVVAAIAGNFSHGAFRAQDLGFSFPVPRVHSASSTAVGGAALQQPQQLDSLGAAVVTATTPNRDVTLTESFPVATVAGPVPTSSNDQLFLRLAPGSGPYPLLGQRHDPSAMVHVSAPGSVPLQPKHPFDYPFAQFASLTTKGLMSYDQGAASGAAGGMVQPSQLYMHFDPSSTGGIADLQAVRSSAGGMLPMQSMGGAGSTAASPQPATQPNSLPMRVRTAGGGIYGPVQPGGQQQAATPAGSLPPATTFYQQQAPLSFAMFPTPNQPLPLAMPLANLNNQAPFGTAVASGGDAISGLTSSWQPTPSPGGTKMKTPMAAEPFPMNGPTALAAPSYIGSDLPQATQWNIGPDKLPVHRRQQRQQQMQGFGQLTSQQHAAFAKPTAYDGQPSQSGFGQQQPQQKQQQQQQQQQQLQTQRRHSGATSNHAEKEKQRADLLKQTKSFLNPAESRGNGNQQLQQLMPSQHQQLVQLPQQQMVRPPQQLSRSAAPLSTPGACDLPVATDSSCTVNEASPKADEARSISPAAAVSAAAALCSAGITEPAAAAAVP